MHIPGLVTKKNIFSLQIDPVDFEPAEKDSGNGEAISGTTRSFFAEGMHRLCKNPLAVIGGVIIAVILLMAVFAPVFCPYRYTDIISVNGERDITARYLSPFTYSETENAAIACGQKIAPHIFGTDTICRDYFIRVIYGTRVSLMIGIISCILVLFIGMIYGAVSGYAGGKVDMIMMRIVDLISALPDMLIIILLSVVLNALFADTSNKFVLLVGPNMISLFTVFALLYWTGMARMVRSQILSIKKNVYVTAARAMGASPGKIIRKHIIPNSLGIIIITATQMIPSAIFTESFLSFIGIGVKAPMPSLGSLAESARSALSSYPYLLIFPALMICLIVLSFNLLGDAVRDAFDPKLRK